MRTKPGEVWLADLGKQPFLREASFVNVQGIASIPSIRLERKLGQLSPELLEKIKSALRSRFVKEMPRAEAAEDRKG